MDRILDEIDEEVFTDRINHATASQEVYEQSGKLRSLISLLEECGLLTITASGKVEPNQTKKGKKDEELGLNTSLLANDDSNTHRALIF